MASRKSAPMASRCSSFIPRICAARSSRSSRPARPPVSIFTALAIYFVIWWIVLFVVLPWGVHSQHESQEVVPGTDPGAPILTNLKLKLVWTTIVASLVFAAWFVVYVYRLITVDQVAAWLGMAN